MKRRKREFSLREQRLIDGFIEDICMSLHLPNNSRDLYQCAWAAFLSVYRDNPSAFSRSGSHGWKRAYSIIWDALAQEQQSIHFWLYTQTSLDQPVSHEIPVSRIELLQAPHSDFQNSVCFHDYLHRIERDSRLMAYELIQGSTMDEIQSYYRWNSDHTYHTYNNLRAEMQEYLNI